MAVVGDYAYVADNDSGLRVILVSDPANPVEVGYYDTPGPAFGVAVAGNHVYVADAWAGLRVISVSDPANPVEVGYYDTPGSAWGVAVVGNYAYVADYYAGLQIIEFYGAGVEEERSTPYALRATPIPTIVRGVLEMPGGSDFPVAKSRGLETSPTFLLDISGRKVQELHPGANDVSRLAPGVYFVRSEDSGQRSAVSRVVIQR